MSSLPPINPTGVSTPFLYNTSNSVSPGITGLLNADPGSTNAPLIFEPPPQLTSGQLQIWMVATGVNPNWGGCQVLGSLNGTSYSQIGTILTGGVQGFSTADFPPGSDPDTVDTLSLDLTESAGIINTATVGDADAFITLARIDSEIIAYSNSTLTGPSAYNLDTYIRRGVYGTTIADHPTSSPFALLNTAVFREIFLSSQIGLTVYFKFPAFNLANNELQDPATVTAYPYTILGTGLGTATQWYQAASVGAKLSAMPPDPIDGNFEIFNVTMPVGVAFPLDFSTSPVPTVSVAPGANVTLTFQHISGGVPTTVGTLNFASGSTIGTFSASPGFFIPAGDSLRLYAPSTVDTTISGLSATIVGAIT
jgi:hypothetical protein